MRATPWALSVVLVAACDLDPPPRYPDYSNQQQYAVNAQATATADVPADQPPSYAYASDEVTVGADSSSEYVDTDASALVDFHASLDPYGGWVDDPTYGTVWVPSSTVVGPDFVPYVSRGHWVYEDDYVWVSEYDWGWGPFHYGRWVYVAGVGWAWIPGRTYRGAWVVWRTGQPGYGYVGWAPAPPVWIWRGGVAVGIGFVPSMPYTFCSQGDLFHPVVASRVVRGSQVAVVANNTRPWTPATPSVGDRTPARPTVGPPPHQLGLDPTQVPHAPTNDPGLLRATQASKPIPRPMAPLGQGPSYLPPQLLPHQATPTPTPITPSSPSSPPPIGPTTRPAPTPFYPGPVVNPPAPVPRPTPQPFPTPSPAPRPPVVTPAPIVHPTPAPPPVVRPITPAPTVRPSTPPPGARPSGIRR